ncbi:hypothetical protein ABT336_11995 [Micromonospora sp. NPDC000207]|uniref:hypothetical protein n=1 Tax=Micromonospora sp. NPDC000207 TaxID=3154246 RepID=UPI00333466F5
MADRRLPYARTLAVLRVLSWPYRYPPLSWMVALVDWLAATNRRLTATVVLSALILIASIVWKVNHG